MRYRIALALGWGAVSSSSLAAALSLDFTTGSLDPRITFTRASGGTYFDASGVLQLASTNTPRFDYDPTTLAARGLLIEEQRTNLLLNSKIDGTNLATQSVTLPASAHTLSFYGTGTVTLSGASTAGPLVGTGATNRVSLTFTPTAGSVTFTVTGTVKWANLELGAFATSHIPTAGASATRSADLAVMTGTNFSNWFNASEGTFVVEYRAEAFASTARIFGVSDGTTSNRLRLYEQSSIDVRSDGNTAGVSQFILDNIITDVASSTHKTALAYKTNNFATCSDAGTVATDVSGNPPTGMNVLALGSYEAGIGGAYLGGWIKSLKFYNTRLTDVTLQELTT